MLQRNLEIPFPALRLVLVMMAVLASVTGAGAAIAIVEHRVVVTIIYSLLMIRIFFVAKNRPRVRQSGQATASRYFIHADGEGIRKFAWRLGECGAVLIVTEAFVGRPLSAIALILGGVACLLRIKSLLSTGMTANDLPNL